MAQARENYGIDAPTVVRNLAGAGFLLLIVSAATAALLQPQIIRPSRLAMILRNNGLVTAIMCLVMAGWMIASSRWLNRTGWRAPCSIAAPGAATSACPTSVAAVGWLRWRRRGACRGQGDRRDIWQEVDLGGNSPEAIRASRRGGVADSARRDTGDARPSPIPTQASKARLDDRDPQHPGRRRPARAIAEAWRVTRPGGQILIFDIRHARKYAAQLRALGAEVKLTGPILLWGPMGRFSAEPPADRHCDRCQAGGRSGLRRGASG